MTSIPLTVLQPPEAQDIVPALSSTARPEVWVYRFEDADRGWTLSIATHGKPGSGQLSLGGFRIVPAERASPGFDGDREAIELAIGMEEKVYWSRLVKAGGPLVLRDSDRIVGGKCVLLPSPDARVGMQRDAELLDWATDCFREFEATSGVLLATGQDLGHGTMSDGATSSLDYLSARFSGCIHADTSKPTAEGNFLVLAGMLRALGIPLDQATVGLIGAGNIGGHIVDRLAAAGATMLAVEADPTRRAALAQRDIRTWSQEGKTNLLDEPIDALVVNASGGTLDPDSVGRCAANPRLKVICGSENLAMSDPAGGEALRAAGKVFCPTEFAGMMGYLTAAEEYLAEHEGLGFDITEMFEAARKLEVVAHRVTQRVLESGYRLSFEDAARAEFA